MIMWYILLKRICELLLTLHLERQVTVHQVERYQR